MFLSFLLEFSWKFWNEKGKTSQAEIFFQPSENLQSYHNLPIIYLLFHYFNSKNLMTKAWADFINIFYLIVIAERHNLCMKNSYAEENEE